MDEQITTMIQAPVEAVEESNPISKTSPYSRTKFMEECKEAQQRARQLKKRWEKIQRQKHGKNFAQQKTKKAQSSKRQCE